MEEAAQPIVTILVANHRTPLLTKVCLRLLRRTTDHTQVCGLVVNNDSRDESLDYLRSLR